MTPSHGRRGLDSYGPEQPQQNNQPKTPNSRGRPQSTTEIQVNPQTLPDIHEQLGTLNDPVFQFQPNISDTVRMINERIAKSSRFLEKNNEDSKRIEAERIRIEQEQKKNQAEREEDENTIKRLKNVQDRMKSAVEKSNKGDEAIRQGMNEKREAQAELAKANAEFAKIFGLPYTPSPMGDNPKRKFPTDSGWNPLYGSTGALRQQPPINPYGRR